MNKRLLYTLIFYFVLFMSLLKESAYADRLDHWKWVTPLPQGNLLYDVTYGDNIFVAVGLKGAIISSNNGYVWQSILSKNTDHLYDIIYADNIFVAVGQNGTIVTSTDGIHWLECSSGTSQTLHGIAYGNDKFVAIGDNGTILTSLNGQDWKERISRTDSDLDCIAFGNGIFVVGGEDTLTSDNGINWVVKEVCRNCSHYTVHSIVFKDDIFLAKGRFHCSGWCSTSGIGTDILKSYNGIEWESTYIENALMGDLYIGNDEFIAPGSMFLGPEGCILTSLDGMGWSISAGSFCEAGLRLRSIVYGNNTYVAVGDQGTISVSFDGVTWLEADIRIYQPIVEPKNIVHLKDIVYGDAGFLIISPSTSTQEVKYLTSTDGVQWSVNDSDVLPSRFTDVTFGNNTYVIVGANGLILSSTNATEWTQRSSGTETNLYAVIYGDGTFVATGNGRVVLTSSNGIDWTKTTPENVGSAGSLAFGNGLFISVGSGGNISTSPDGISWTKRESGVTSSFTDVSFGIDMFVTWAKNETILTSPDGITWTRKEGISGNYWTGIDFVGGMFVAYSNKTEYAGNGSYLYGDFLLTSIDGIDWSFRKTKNPELCGMAEGAGTIIAIGCDGQIQRATGLELSDAILSLQIVAGGIPEPIPFRYVDVNEDGMINLKDVLSILNIIGILE